MKLFQALCRYRNNPNGNIFTGKHRIVKPVTYTDINKMKNQVEIEEKNMFYLRHPYLTVEQSFEHAKALGKPEANFIKTKTKPRPFYDNVTIESRLAHLRMLQKMQRFQKTNIHWWLKKASDRLKSVRKKT